MKALVVYNPYSKNNKIEKNIEYIKDTLLNKYDRVDFFKTQGEKSITNHIEKVHNEYDLIIVSGGDGTINEAINGLAKVNSKTTLGIIPSGTCNDFSKMLKYSKNIKKQLNNILNGYICPIDICKVNDRYFTYGLALGKYTDVSYKAKRNIKRIFGKVAYFIQGLKEFFKYTKLDLSIKTNDLDINDKYYCLLALNSSIVAGFKIKRKNKVKLNDGLIDLTLIKKNTKGLTWPRLMMFFLFGDKQKIGVNTYQASHVEINSSEKLYINTDGELALVTNNLVIDVLKNHLNIIVSDKIKNKYFN